MFQFAPVQLPHSLLREILCCWVPEFTLPSTTESDIQPPLAHPLFWFRTMSPLMCMRRKGTACETAHNIWPPAGVTARPSMAFEKVVVALSLREAASERTLPEIWVASGVAPTPMTSV